MSDFTLTNVQRYPNGTEVKAYPLSNWPNGGTLSESAAPVGSEADTQTMTDGTLTFTGLTKGVEYVAHAEVASQHRYSRFVAGADVAESHDGANLSDDETVTGLWTFDQAPALPNNTVQTADIQDDAVTAAKLADHASTDASRAVTTNHIRDGAVTAAKVAADVATQAELDAAQQTITANTQTGDYTLVLADAGKVVEVNAATAKVVTVPPNSSVAFAVGTVIEVSRYGAGTVTLAPDAGVTIRSPGSFLAITHQYGSVSLRKRATDEWVLVGDLS